MCKGCHIFHPEAFEHSGKTTLTAAITKAVGADDVGLS